MTFGARGFVAVVELVVYLPAAVLALKSCAAHGWRKASGWIYTAILSIVRIIGAVCWLLTYVDKSPNLFKAAIIFDSIGLSPLLLAVLGVLSRAADWINSEQGSVLGMKLFRLVQLAVTLGLILSVSGGATSSTGSNNTPSATAKIGIILYIVGFAGLCYVFALAVGYRQWVPQKEQRIYLAVTISLPLVAVRLLYAALAVFVHNKTFSTTGGSIIANVCMAIIEECLVVVTLVILGANLDKLEQNERGEIAHREWKNRQGRSGREAGNPLYNTQWSHSSWQPQGLPQHTANQEPLQTLGQRSV